MRFLISKGEQINKGNKEKKGKDEIWKGKEKEQYQG